MEKAAKGRGLDRGMDAELRAQFRLADVNENMELTRGEILNILGNDLRESQVELLIRHVDQDHSHSISFKEFKAIDADDDAQALFLADLVVSEFDVDSSGGLSVLEFENFLAHMSATDGSEPPPHSLAEVVFNMADANQDGEVSSAEIVAMRAAEEQTADGPPPPQIFDVDGDGYVTADELHVMLVDVGGQRDMTKELIKHLVLAGDHDADGVLNYDEFTDVMADMAD